MDIGRRRVNPVIIRSRLILEIASELVGTPGWEYPQVWVTVRKETSESPGVSLQAYDGPSAIDQIARGELQMAIINPSTILNLAVLGTGPFKEPIPLRAITVIPDYDQMGFAVAESTGIQSLEEIRERRFPLRVSLRGRKDHALHIMTDEVLGAVGFSLDDIVAWGGEVHYDGGIPTPTHRVGAVERGERDAIFDEAIVVWADRAAEIGMRFLPLDEPLLGKLEAIGFRRGTIEKSLYPKLPSDVLTLDFSGFPLYTIASVSDDVVAGVCAALQARSDRIPWEGGDGPLPLERMCRDTVDGPLGIPLHPAAERFWRERGYLD